MDKEEKEVYSAYFRVSDKDFLKDAIENLAFKDAGYFVSLAQGRIFSNNCCFANFSDSTFLSLEEFLSTTE